jgi:hypothetical protein
MSLHNCLDTAAIRSLFAEEVAAAGGSVSDTFDDGKRLFTRSILPGVREVIPGDAFQAGVALRSSDEGTWVHPYLFRQVCRNGAIVAHALQSQHVESGEFDTPAEAAATVREAVRACCSGEAFTEAITTMRTARERVAGVAINLLPLLSRLPPELGTQIFRKVVERFFDGEDASQYGLMNAVTSVARDTADPDLRWRLEELGGGLPAERLPTTDPDDTAAAAIAAATKESVAVG